jgi:ribosome-associated protein
MPQLLIPLSEIQFQFSRSGGPGGQNVNRRETRVELLFDVRNSPSLNEEQRLRLRTRLASRVDRNGILHVVSSAERSQLINRQRALDLFVQLLRRGLRVSKSRVATRPSKRSAQERLEEKRRRGGVKQQRQQVKVNGEP